MALLCFRRRVRRLATPRDLTDRTERMPAIPRAAGRGREPSGAARRVQLRSQCGGRSTSRVALRRKPTQSPSPRHTLAVVASSDPGYFSDIELGPRPLVLDDLPPAAWIGISATFQRFADQQYFAAEFPEQCPDGRGVSGTSLAGLRALLVSHLPTLGGWPREDEQPDTVTAMDLVVFGWNHRWRAEINRILSRNAVALRQEPDRRVIRVGTTAAGVVTQSPLPATGDARLDEKIATALRKYRDPDVDVRREALEALWDAFERIKTVIDPTDKKTSAEALVELMVTDLPSRKAITDEFAALTHLGNDFQIRHHAIDKY